MSQMLSPEFLVSGFVWSRSEDDFVVGESLIHSATPLEGRSGALYAPEFFASERAAYFYPRSVSRVTRDELLDAVRGLRDGSRVAPSTLQWSGISKPLFLADFDSIQATIARGDVEKIVITGFDLSRSQVDGERLRGWIEAVLNARLENQHVYGVWHGGAGIVGATPEVLFELDPSRTRLSTMAFAGTRSAHHDGVSLIEDRKESYEHTVVVRGITEALAPCRVEQGETAERTLRHTSHLCTPLICRSEEPWDVGKLIERLHPTPALGAYPREAGLTWLRAHDHFGGGFPTSGRQRFGAPFGWIEHRDESGEEQSIKVVVAIRNVQWRDGEIAIGAGCGIVRESVVERELSELETKIGTVKEWFAESGELGGRL